MTDFAASRSPSSSPDPTKRLFVRLISVRPEVAPLLEKTMGRIFTAVICQGGRISITSEGPEQGITIEVGGKIHRISPTNGECPEDAKLIDNFSKSMSSLSNALEIDIGTLRVLMATDSRFRKES